MIYRRVVKRVIISRENLKELTFEDVSLRGTRRHRFRNRVASVFPRLETGIRENTIGRFRFFFFFFLLKRFFGISIEKPWESRQSEEK